MRIGTGWLWLALVVVVGVGVGVVAFPTFYIMPFRTQDAGTLGWALTARTIAPVVTAAASALAAALALWLVTRGRRWWSRLTPLVLVAPLALATWFARQNHFEWMFSPQNTLEHVESATATFVEPDDLVMAVERNGASIAYPIRQLAYHHIANDVVAGEPIVATY
jgi:hypothetical protein